MSKAKHKKSFLVHTDSLEILDDLTDEQAGKLFKAIKDYQFGNEPKLSQLIKIAFNPFKNYFERDNDKWEAEVEKRREAGRLGAEARWGVSKDAKVSQEMARDGKGIVKMASAISANSKMANIADSVSVSVSVSESVSENEKRIVISLPLNDNTDYDINQSTVNEYTKLYLAVDIEQELRKMKGWLKANASKRKTRRGVPRFIVNWLSREQDRGASQKADKSDSYGSMNKTIRATMEKQQSKNLTIDEIKAIKQQEYDEKEHRRLNVH